MNFTDRQLRNLPNRIEKCPETNCWNWTGSLNRGGYGRTRTADRRFVLAHRVFYELYKGAVPKGMVIDHLCRNRKCVNPAHLDVVTNRVNILRGIGFAAKNAVKAHCVNGHEFTPENTYVYVRRGSTLPERACRTCRREAFLRFHAKAAA